MRLFGRYFCIWMLLLVSACGLLVEEGRGVLAEVGGDPIRLNDLFRRIRELPFERRAQTNDPDEAIRLEARRSVLMTLINEKLLAKEAETRGIAVSDEEVEAAFEHEEERKNAMGGFIGEDLGGAMSGHDHSHGGEGHTRSERKDMRQRLAIEKMLALQLSDVAVKRYYDEHGQEFALSPPLLNCELIVVQARDKSFIDTIQKRALQEEATLSTILATSTDIPRLVFAGTTPLAPLSELAPSMRTSVEGLKVGETSEPFSLYPEGEEQYAVARVINYIDKRPFESVKEPIRTALFNAFMEELKQKYGVVQYEEKLNYRLERL